MKNIEEMTLDEKIGQLMICGFHGTTPSLEIRNLIEEKKIGGVIYFSRNIKDPKQVYQLSKELQVIAHQQSDIPLFISIDQEGGMVARLTEGVTLIPGNMALGAVDDEDVVLRTSEIAAKELKALGINFNLAPSLDVNNNPKNPVIGVRSYGDNPERVSQLGLSAIKGFQKSGVCTSAKHFPGHGDTATDSHFDLPTILHNKDRLHRIELIPFVNAIQHQVDSIMSAHIVLPAYDALLPATLSSNIINGLLRRELGYEGVVMTDCLEMHAITKQYGVEKAAVLAIEAGIDLILVSHTYEQQLKAINAIKEAVNNGRISEERITQSVNRILLLKDRRGLRKKIDEPEVEIEVLSQLRASENVAFVNGISHRSITVIKDENNQIPLNPIKRLLIISPKIQALNAADESFNQQETIGTFLSHMLPKVEEITVPLEMDEDKRATIVNLSKDYDQVIVATYNTDQFADQIALVQSLQKYHQHLIVVAVRNPFDFLDFPNVPTQVASYESRPMALKSIALVLAGKVQPQGKLPVHL